VSGEVTLSNISLEQYNGDAALQKVLRSDLAQTAGSFATAGDVTLSGARTQQAGGGGSSRRLLEEPLLVIIDYTIVFASIADAEAAKTNLAAISRLVNVEAHAQAQYAGLQVGVSDEIDVRGMSPPSVSPTPAPSPLRLPTTAVPTRHPIQSSPSHSPTDRTPSFSPTAIPTSPCDASSTPCDTSNGGVCFDREDGYGVGEGGNGYPYACACEGGTCIRGCDFPYDLHRCRRTQDPTSVPTYVPTTAPTVVQCDGEFGATGCNGHGECVTSESSRQELTRTCECETLFAGNRCEACTTAGTVYPDCNQLAAPAERLLNKNTIVVSMVWGVDDIKRLEGESFRTSTTLTGEVVLNGAFDPANEEAQRFLFNACLNVNARLDLVQPQASKCALNRMMEWVVGNVNVFESRYQTTRDDVFNLHVSNMVENVRKAAASLEVEGQVVPERDKPMDFFFVIPPPIFSDIAVLFLTQVGNKDYRELLGLDDAGASVTWIRNTFQSTLSRSESGLTMKPTFNTWEDFVTELNTLAPPAAGLCYQTRSFL
jgi:hypothetical protein